MENDKLISGNPIRFVAVVLAIASAVTGAFIFEHIGGLLLGAIVGILNAVLLYGFATIVDACYKYLGGNKPKDDSNKDWLKQE